MRGVVTAIAAFVVFATLGRCGAGRKASADDIQSTFFNGQPFTAATPSNVKFKMTFTADGKMKREPPVRRRQQGRRHLAIVEGRLLHHLERRQSQLLHRRQRRRQQMVGAEGLDHLGDVEQIALSVRASKRRCRQSDFRSPSDS